MSTRLTKLHREAVFADCSCSECLDCVLPPNMQFFGNLYSGEDRGEMRERGWGDRKGGAEAQKTGEIMCEFASQFALPL